MVLGDALGINQGAVRDYKDTPIGRWFKLQEDLLNIYNKAKRDFHFYHSSVVSFHFTTHTDFSFKSVPVDEFILSVEHLMNGHYVHNILLKSYLAIFFIFQIIIAIFIDPLRTTASFIALTLTFPMLCALLSFHPESLSA